jgi:hypothetical protein
MLEYTIIWAKGDSLQGKIMLAAGIFFLFAFIGIMRSDDPLYRGTLIPIGLLLVLLLGYGGFLAFSRPGHIQKISQLYKKSPEEAKEVELKKASNDHRNYSLAKKIWPFLIILSAIGFMLFTADYYKGLSIGLLIAFISVLIVDITLHHRLTPYLEYLQG